MTSSDQARIDRMVVRYPLERNRLNRQNLLMSFDSHIPPKQRKLDVDEKGKQKKKNSLYYK